MEWLFTAALYAPILPLGLGIIRVRRLSLGQMMLGALCIFYLLNQGMAAVVASYLKSNYPFFHLHVVVELAMLSWIFIADRGSVVGRKAQALGIVIFATAAIINAFFGEGLWNAPSVPLIVESLMLLGVVSGFFWKTYREMLITHFEQEFLFWVSLGILIYFAGTLLLDIFLVLIVGDEAIFNAVFVIRDFLIILTNICYAIGMLCKAHPQKS